MIKSITPFVTAVIKVKQRYLLTKRQEIDKEDPSDFVGKWQLPGGGINFGESPEKALIREIKEETGLDIKIKSVVPYIINSFRTNWHGIGIVLCCKLIKKGQKVKLNHEASNFGWFSYKEAMKLDILPGGKEALYAAKELI